MIAAREGYLLTPPERERLALVDNLLAVGGAAADDLVGMLEDPSWTVRRAVVAALVGMGGQAAPALCTLLERERRSEDAISAAVEALVAMKTVPWELLERLAHHHDPAVVADAAQILGRRRDPQGLECLKMLVDHPDDNVSVGSIEGLGRMGAAAAAVDVLRRVVQSGNFFRTFPAIDVLGRSQDPRAVDALGSLLDQAAFAPEAIRALSRTSDPRAVTVLGSVLLGSSQALVRSAAIALQELRLAHQRRFDKDQAIDEALSRLPRKEAVRARLEQALRDADTAERLAIIAVLGGLGSQAAAPCLELLLASGEPDVARAAANALKRLQVSAEGQLVAALETGDRVQRLAILPLLTQHSSLPEIRVCASDTDPDVRAAACQALARLADDVSLPMLFELLGDEDQKVALAALSTIQAIGGQQVESLALQMVNSPRPELRRSALRVLGYFAFAAALPALLAACRDTDTRVRDAAISALAFMDAPEAKEHLVTLASSPDSSIRACAMRTLGLINDPRAHAELLRGLHDADAWVRYHACQSVGKLRLVAAAPKVEELLADSTGQVRVAAVEALSRMPGSVGIEALAQAARSTDLDIRRAALVGLGLSANAAARPHLLEAMASPDAPTRMMAISGIAALPGQDVAEAMWQACHDRDESVRVAAVGALGASAGDRSVELLLSLLESTPSDGQRDHLRAALAVPAPDRALALFRKLPSASEAQAQELVAALVRLPNRGGERALLAAMSSPLAHTRKAVAPALAAMGTRASELALQTAAQQDPDETVREVAALAATK